MKRLLKLYRFILICMVIAFLALSAVAWYTVGVVELHDTIGEIDVNIESMKTAIEKNEENGTLLQKELTEDYKSKTRVVAMILDNGVGETLDDRTLEELRVAIGADMISVSDASGNIISSTDPSGAGTVIADPFLNHIQEIVYTDVEFYLEEADPSVMAASTLGSGNGMVQICYPADSVRALLQKTDVEKLAEEMPLYESGATAIVDIETMCFLTHSTPDKIGQKSVFNEKNFLKKKGRIDTEIDGIRQMVRYQVYENQVIMAIVPFSDVYQSRNIVVGWMLGGGAIVLLIAILAMRMQWITIKQEMRQTE